MCSLTLHVGLICDSCPSDQTFAAGFLQIPPHGGLAYGLDRWVSLFAGLDSIRDCIAFPKNNSGRDTMIDAPSVLEPEQLTELNIVVNINEK